MGVYAPPPSKQTVGLKVMSQFMLLIWQLIP